MKITAILIMLFWVLLIITTELRTHNFWRKRTYREHRKLLDQFALALRDDMRESEKNIVLSLGDLQRKVRTLNDLREVKLDVVHNTITEVKGETMHLPGTLDNIKESMDATNNTINEILINTMHVPKGIDSLKDGIALMAKTIDSITPIVCDWGKAQTENIVKKGESHRTLRRRLKECDKHIQELTKRVEEQDQTIKEQDKQNHLAKATRNDIIEEFRHEIKLIRAWLTEKGVPHDKLDSHLKAEFKGSIPSHTYQVKADESMLRDAITNKRIPTKTRFA